MYLKDYSEQSDDFQKIEKAIQFIETNFKSHPTLDQIAESIHLSKYHFDRLFKRWAGVSPIQFLQFLTLEHTKEILAESKSLLDTSMEAGLSGTGRLHDLFVTFEAMTPGDFKKQGKGLTITYGFNKSPFGECLLAITKRGICYFGFADKGDRPEVLNQLFKTWPGSIFKEDSQRVLPIVMSIFNIDPNKIPKPFNLTIKGTNFQVNVWKALLKIPEGKAVCYQDIASYLGVPQGFRAVANAIAHNPVAYLIPCHRVIAKSGVIHKYRWGAERKKAMLGLEATGIT